MLARSTATVVLVAENEISVPVEIDKPSPHRDAVTRARRIVSRIGEPAIDGCGIVASFKDRRHACPNRDPNESYATKSATVLAHSRLNGTKAQTWGGHGSLASVILKLVKSYRIDC